MRKRLDALSDKCSEFVCGPYRMELEESINALLPRKHGWILDVDPVDRAKQTLLFHYPKAAEDKTAGYIQQAVKIEFGARADHWPAEEYEVESFISESYPDVMENSKVRVRALKAERTFWEKATILHSYAYYPEQKKIPVRQSRHFYDFFRLLESDVKNLAETDLELFKRVAEHKSIYFRAKWASYETAKKGTLKLIPEKHVIKEMEKDYKSMSEMFYGTVPSWQEIIDLIGKFESSFNQISTTELHKN